MSCAPETAGQCSCQSAPAPATDASAPTAGKPLRSLSSVVVAVLISVFPKCPVCWAAYMSVLSGLGLAQLPYAPWMLPLLGLVLAINLYFMFRQARSHNYYPLLISAIGLLLILASRYVVVASKLPLVLGVIIMIAGSVWNNLYRAQIRVFSKK